ETINSRRRSGWNGSARPSSTRCRTVVPTGDSPPGCGRTVTPSGSAPATFADNTATADRMMTAIRRSNAPPGFQRWPASAARWDGSSKRVTAAARRSTHRVAPEGRFEGVERDGDVAGQRGGDLVVGLAGEGAAHGFFEQHSVQTAE